MTEITRVPIQPIRKGSLIKLWIGVLALVLVGGGIAWLTVPGGVKVEVVTAGKGEHPKVTDVVLVNYVGKLADGTLFDEGKSAPLPLQGVMPGFAEGLLQMQKGGKYVLHIPADKAYGPEEKRNPQTGEVVIPANSDLVFEVELLNYMDAAEFERRAQMQQQLMQMQQKGEQGEAPPK